MKFSFSSLKSELVNDPASLGYAGKTVTEKASLLNSLATGRKKYDLVMPISSLLIWLAQNNRLGKITAAAASFENADIKNICNVAVRIFGSIQSIDIDNPSFSGMIDALVASNVLSLDDKTSLYTMKGYTSINRCQELWEDRNSVDWDEVRQAEAMS